MNPSYPILALGVILGLQLFLLSGLWKHINATGRMAFIVGSVLVILVAVWIYAFCVMPIPEPIQVPEPLKVC